MKLTVLTWLRDSSIQLVGRTIELVFRTILFFLPLGVFLMLIQARNGASTIRNISVYTTDESKWQHVFPGFILVAIDPKIFEKRLTKFKTEVQTWIASNKYLIGLLFMFLVVLLLYVGMIK